MSNYSKIERKTANGLETILDLTGDTVTAETLKKGYTAHGANGDPILGTMEATSGGIVLSEETTVTPETLGKGITAYNNKGELITGTMTSSIPQYPDFSLEDADCVIEDEIIEAKLYYQKALPGKFIYCPNAISIGDQAFYGKNGDTTLQKFYAPKCTTIGKQAFYYSDNLCFLALPNLLTFNANSGYPVYKATRCVAVIGTNQSTVAYCPGYEGANAYTLFYFKPSMIFVPDALLDAYKEHPNWGGSSSNIGKDTIHPISEYGK